MPVPDFLLAKVSQGIPVARFKYNTICVLKAQFPRCLQENTKFVWCPTPTFLDAVVNRDTSCMRNTAALMKILLS